MKKIITILFLCASANGLHAQRCLDINILSLMGNLQVPGSGSACFSECATTKNDHQQTIILNYGTADIQLDEMVKRKMQDFTDASVGNMSVSSQMPSSNQVEDAKALAAKMQSMSPEERKAYAMQMAQQMQANPAASINTDNAETIKLVMKTQDIVTVQLKSLDDELAAKFREIRSREKKDFDAVKRSGDNECPGVDKTGLPSCACVNALASAYWTKIVSVEDSYNYQKAALLQSYIPRMKSLVGTVEDNISKLQHGDAVKSAYYKKVLFSAQSSAFGFAFDITGAVIHDIRKTGADAYVHKYNSDKKVEDLSCSQ